MSWRGMRRYVKDRRRLPDTLKSPATTLRSLWTAPYYRLPITLRVLPKLIVTESGGVVQVFAPA